MDNQVCMGLRALKLSGMSAEFARQQITPASADASIDLRMLQMIAAEEDMRADRRRKRLLAESGLNPAIAPESIDFDPRRGLDRPMIEELLNCRWIRLGNNATIVGMTGSGKSYLATSFGRAAIRQGLSVRSVQAHLLAEDMAIARIDGSLRKLRQTYKRA